MIDQPAYLHLADDLRASILDGTLPPGSRLPSLKALAQRHHLSEIVARQALRVLVSEGLVETRFGSGSYVRARPQTRRLVRGRYGTQDSPFRTEMESQDKQGSWESRSERAHASPAIAERLQIDAGDEVMRTSYRFLADQEPIQLSTSYEPLAVTRDTPVLLPEEGPHAGIGVRHRMASIGLHCTDVREEITARPPLLAECQALNIPTGVYVFEIHRTHYATQTPVETADIVLPVDRYTVTYDIPTDTDETM